VARLDFANARLGARRSRLCGPAVLRDLLARPSLEARLELLRGLPVGREIPVVAGEDPLRAAERALRAAIRADAVAILADAEGTRARHLLVAFLALDEAAAVKAVLRGVLRGAPIDETLAAVPAAPGVGDAGLRAAAAASTLAAAADALAAAGSAVAAAIRPAVPDGDGAPDLVPLEVAADRFALARARAACRGGEDAAVLARHLADRADVRNATTLLLVAGSEAGAAPWLAGGRRWTEAELERLARAGQAEARAAVAAGFPGTGAALAHPWTADRALAAAIVLRLHREARLRPHSIAVPLAYLAARREEARRVALVLRGTFLGLPGEEILELVDA
jgi:V/A-type H+-transporting ATPase subunit C